MVKTYLFILKACLLAAAAIHSHDMACAQKLPGFQYEEGAIIRGDTASNTIFLVFTGGDYNDGGPYIRKVLKEQKVPAHFFFTGDFYRNEENKALVEGLKQDGHYLGAHSDKHLLYASWDNCNSLLVDKETFRKDLEDNYRAMAAYGITTEAAPFFLPPYEWYNATISRWTEELGLQLINFSLREPQNRPKMGKALRDGELFLHVIGEQRPQALVLLVSSSATAAAVTAAAAAAVAAAIAAAAAATAATTATIAAVFGFLNDDGPAVQLGVVQVIDRISCFIIIGHFHEAETFGAAGEFIHDNLYGIHLSEFLERVLKVLFTRIVV